VTPNPRVPKIRPTIALLAAVIAASATVTTPAAAQHCRSYWTAAYRCAMGCGGCPSSGPVAPVAPMPPPAPVLPPDPFPQDLSTYQDLVRRIGGAAQRGAPSSSAALSAQLDRLGGDMAQQIDATFGSLSDSRNTRDSYRWTIANLPARLDELQRSIARLRAAQASAETRAELRRQELARADRRANALSQIASDYSADTVETRRSIAGWLYVTVPVDVRMIEPDAWRRAQDIPAPAVHGIDEAFVPPPLQPLFHGTAASGVPHYSGSLPTVAGTNAQKLAAVESMTTILEDLRGQAAVAAREASALRSRAEALIKEKGVREGTLRLADQALTATDKTVQSDLSAARQRLDAATGRLLARAAENFAWRMLKEHMVKPEVARFLDENRRWYQLGHTQLNDDAVSQLVAQGKLALDLLSARAGGLDRVVGVEKKVLDAMDDWHKLVLEVPQLMASATPGELDAFSRDFNARSDRAMLEIAQESAGQPFGVSIGQLRDPGLPPQIVALGRKLKLIREE